MSILETIKSIFLDGEKGESNDSSNRLLRNIIILGMIGTLLLLTGNLFTNNSPPSEVNNVVVKDKVAEDYSYEERLTRDIEEIISLIRGVGRVKAKLYFELGPRYEFEYNKKNVNKITNENDQNGGERRIEEDNMEEELVIIKDAGGVEKPVLSGKMNPVVSGVMIVAEGAEVSKIKYEIVKAVSNLLNLPVHKISVLPYERR